MLFQDSYITIDEKGTEAAAVTAEASALGVFRYEEFIADHPFLYIIKENSTGAILFMGKFTGD